MANDMWTNMGNGQFANVAVGVNSDGRLEVFTYLNSSTYPIYHAWQTAPNGGWTTWSALGAPVVGDPHYFNTAFSGMTDIFVGMSGDPSNCLRVVTQGGWTISQVKENGGWGAWSRLGSPPNAGLVTGISRSVDGRL
jgi:hypothetical protein